MTTPVALPRMLVAADDLPCGYFRLTDDGRLAFVNARLRELLHLPVTAPSYQRLDQFLTAGARLFCELTILPTLRLAGAVSEIYLTMAAADGATVAVLVDATLSSCGRFSDWTVHTMAARDALEVELMRTKRELEASLEKERATSANLVLTLEDLRRTHSQLTESNWLLERVAEVIPTCMYCSKIRSTKTDWETVGAYLARSKVLVSHGCCPDCTSRLLSDMGLLPDGPVP